MSAPRPSRSARPDLREHLAEPGWSPSRRSLVKGAAALGLPIVLGGRARAQEDGVPEPLDEEREPLPPLKVGLVGCGGRGTGAAWQAMQAEQGSVVLWAMGDVFADRLESSATTLETMLAEGEQSARMDVPAERRFLGFDAFERVMDSGIDVVLLCTPPAFRPAHLERAVKKRLHIFCEKPVAVDVPGALRVARAALEAEAAGLCLVSGFCWRYNDRHRAFFERLHQGAIGELQAVYTNYLTGPIGTHERAPEWSDLEWQLRNWHHFRWASGDHIVEQACHSIDKQSWAFGDVPPVRAIGLGGCQTRVGATKGNTWDNFSVVYEYANGAKGILLARQWPNSFGENNDYFYGSLGHARIENWTPYHQITGPGSWAWEYQGEGNDMYQQEHDDLFAAIRAGEVRNDGQWMTRSTLLALMGREAAYSGRAVTWEELLALQHTEGPAGLETGLLEFGDLAAGEEPVPGRYELG